MVRLGNAATCDCGEAIAPGERAGALVPLDRVFCLGCMADVQAGRLDLSALAPALAAAEHNARVSANADTLLNRLHAARLMATLVAEPPQPPADVLADRLPDPVEPLA